MPFRRSVNFDWGVGEVLWPPFLSPDHPRAGTPEAASQGPQHQHHPGDRSGFASLLHERPDALFVRAEPYFLLFYFKTAAISSWTFLRSRGYSSTSATAKCARELLSRRPESVSFLQSHFL